MFEFLEAYEHVNLIKDFMHAWHKVSDDDSRRNAGLIREDDEQKKKRREQAEDELQVALRQRVEQVRSGAKRVVAEDVEYDRQQAPTVAEISEGTGLSDDQIRGAMKAAEDDFVHWPHPAMTRYVVREHAERMGYENWQPGTDF